MLFNETNATSHTFQQLFCGIRLLVEIFINASKFMSAREDLFLLLMIFMDENVCSQMYVDPKMENIFIAKFFKRRNSSNDKEL